jgi:hypothetical protein
MASQNPIHTLSTPKPVERPRANPLATTARTVGYGRSRGLSDHSGRQGKIMSITPSVAHKNTNRSTPMRRSHRRATDGERLERETGTGACAGTTGTAVSAGDLSPPTLVESLAKGSLGSEIIARVVVDKARDRFASPAQFRTHSVHSTTSEPECARPRRDNRYSRRTRR